MTDTRESREAVRDLGFGSRVANDPWVRLLDRDGSYNLVRKGLSRLGSVSVYGLLQRMGWWQFYLLVAGAYLGVNLLFAGAYLACGPEALRGATAASLGGRFLEAFFFSVQTLTTVGYGTLAPAGVAANAVASGEALLGLGGFAVVAALFFARLARPQARVGFSERALVAPYSDGEAFEFRLVNASRNELLEVEVEVVYTFLVERTGGGVARRFRRLALERSRIAFFPLHWTVVHPIDASSPLHGKRHPDLIGEAAEFLVQVRAIDEAHAAPVLIRTSYRADEIAWGARFPDIYERTAEGVLGIDVRRIHEIEPLEPAAGAEAGA
jgi:inward rectifier potassium channel